MNDSLLWIGQKAIANFWKKKQYIYSFGVLNWKSSLRYIKYIIKIITYKKIKKGLKLRILILIIIFKRN
jgi:hypothetical protein